MRPKVLIVEDDMMMRTIFELYIQQSDLELIGIATNGKEALNICQNTSPDILLIDIHLDDEMNGIELGEIITEKFDLPYIFISADPNTEIIEMAAKQNAYGFLLKPLYKNNLKSTIYFAIAKHKNNSKQNS